MSPHIGVPFDNFINLMKLRIFHSWVHLLAKVSSLFNDSVRETATEYFNNTGFEKVNDKTYPLMLAGR